MIAGVGPSGVPETRFAMARGARLAYQSYGSGDATVVSVPPLAQNLEAAWELPALRAMFERMGSFARWVPYDKRGSGASDRRSRVPGIDERVDDLRAVMDAAEVERAFLFGASEGGPTCLLFAATYPDRVEGVALFGSGPYTEDPNMDDDTLGARRGLHAWLVDRWGTSESPMVDVFSPSLAHDDAYRQWHERYERVAADRDSLRELLEISLSVDVSSALGGVDVPVLVMHRVDDPVVPIAYGRAVADLVPTARLVELLGPDHYAFAGDQGWLDELERFVTGRVSASPPIAIQPRTRIFTLGRFGVEVDGRSVPHSDWGSQQARVLCKRLVAARGWPITREELFELLWPDETDARRLSSRLSVQLSAVRRILGGGVIADRQTVALDLHEVSTDVEALFEADDDRTLVDLYTGEFLPEDRYDDWTAAVRHEARMRFVAAARRLGESALASGETVVATSLAGRLVEADRYDESGHRLLVEALQAAGERQAARHARERWHSAMDEIGVRPSE